MRRKLVSIGCNACYTRPRMHRFRNMIGEQRPRIDWIGYIRLFGLGACNMCLRFTKRQHRFHRRQTQADVFCLTKHVGCSYA